MSRRPPNNKVDVVLGAQWGDEGKGKLVDMLSVDMDVTARCAGGNNAGHTVLVDGIKVKFFSYPVLDQGYDGCSLSDIELYKCTKFDICYFHTRF